ncbi:DMT family transporter [Puniceicoccaceae bacterium K14]|nr:DMT family transporter [Puniceicoccaceae bacterium K14]
MDWILLGVISAVFLGVYDLLKKRSITGNAVIPVLFLSICCGAIVWLPSIILSYIDNYDHPISFFSIEPIGLKEHVQFFSKSSLVGTSWILSYFALKNMPVSLATGIRATSPLWTLGGAIILFAERPNWQQWLGIFVTLAFFFLLSLAGKKEGFIFHRNGWVGCMILATLIGAGSALYDKLLLTEYGYPAATVQAYFSFYLVLFMLPFAIGWKLRIWERGNFEWRWSIPFISLCLLVADYAYFSGLGDPESMISVMSCIRRGSALVVFVGGYLFFKERNYRAKTPCILGILLGICIIVTA